MLADLRLALRQIAGAPGFTALVVVTLALGIGACTAIFTVVHGVVLKPLPYPDADRILLVGEVDRAGDRPVGGSVSPVNFLDWRAQNTVFSHLAAMRGSGFNFVLPGGEPQRTNGLRVSADYFAVLGVAPAFGRDFTAEDDREGAERVVLLADAFWRQQFGAAPDVLGRTLLLNGEPHRVIGVMPAELARATTYQFWIPLALTATETAPRQRGSHYLNVLGRLRPGVSAERAQTEMNHLAERLAAEYPEQSRGDQATAMPYLDYLVGPTRPILLALLAAVGALLLIACANVANLLLARGASRARELAVRTALGAPRTRLVRQLLTESTLLALLGGALGLLAARWGLDALLWLAPASLPRSAEIALDPTVLGAVTALVLLTGIGFGLAPALQSTRIDLVEGLKDGARGQSEGGRRRRLRQVFVVAELALALALLAGAGLLMRSFLRLQQVDPGFRADNVTTLTVSAPTAKYDTPAKRVAIAEAYAERIRALPGVVAAGATHSLPAGAGGEDMFGFEIEGRERREDAQLPAGTYYVASDGYFEAMGMSLVRGRTFTPHDRADSAPVVIISQGLAERFFPGEDPIGRRLSITNGPQQWREIVGVVRDIRHLGLDDGRSLQLYEPLAQRAPGTLHFAIRTARPDPGLPAALRALVRATDPDQPVVRLAPFESLVAASVARQRFAVTLFGVFSGLALILATVGIYGVVAYTVSQRIPEFGVRVALGAGPLDLHRLVLGEAARLAAVGLGLGLLLALAAGRLVAAMLYQTSATDPLVLGGLTVLLGFVALLAAWLPSRRAARVDPMVALRAE